jgi:cysteine desulfurase
MEPWWEKPANPMSAHQEGRAAAAALDQARQQLAHFSGWKRERVFFTGGATEANTTILSRKRWAVSAVEHPSVRVWAHRLLPVDGEGRCWPQEPGEVDGVSIQLANNETGVIQPVAEWAQFCKERGLLFHVDAAQGPGKLPLPLEPDYLTLSAHKAGGPAGVGALLSKIPFEPLLRGGPQERGNRAGTHNLAGIVGFGAALDQGKALEPELRDRLEAGLVALGGLVAGGGARRLPNTSCVAFEGIEAQDLVMALDLEGVAVSAGAACSSGSTEPSFVLKSMGFKGSAVRFSLGPSTTKTEIEQVLAWMPVILKRMRESPW